MPLSDFPNANEFELSSIFQPVMSTAVLPVLQTSKQEQVVRFSSGQRRGIGQREDICEVREAGKCWIETVRGVLCRG